nr:PREDICTED: transcription factor E4F1 isoform X10 [Tribolium castaneum]|eukprot:XP_015834124.1 PREDICTED: transcription factor E4F1 isoform X10 [Tribolium castaneum]
MGSIENISELCRLCLVKDQVNVPIFEENATKEQTFVKINSCLPVKVSRDDSLPKKICDGCSCKLDMLYTFRNTSVDSEKQLLKWLNQAGLSCSQSAVKDPLASTKPEVTIKQETFEPTDSRDDLGLDTHSYIMQQQKLPYSQEFEFGEPSESNVGLMTDEPAPKKAKRAAALNKASVETDEDDLDAAMQITKAEDEDSDEIDQPEYVEAPSTSADDQPGPSGVNKTTVEAPSEKTTINYSCNVCSEMFPDKNEFLKHHLHQYGQTFNCCKCGNKYKTITDLYSHLEEHKTKTIVVEQDGEVVEEIVLNYENDDEIEDGNELLYILDDSQCVNEVVIEEDIPTQPEDKDKSENLTIVQLEHGYVIPNVVEGEVEEIVALNGKQKTLPAKLQPSTSKVVYAPQPRARSSQPRRRNVVPDFSSTNYLFVSPNEEVDIPHYKCLRCEQLFINKFVFFRHIEKGKCYINNCDVCSATFAKNSEFYYHYVVEHTDRAICNFCFRTFMYEKNVKEHMLRHLDQFRHRCDDCNKGFYTVREYRNHYKNRHMGIRHTCQVCSRSFADEYYFRRHLATHDQAAIVIE